MTPSAMKLTLIRRTRIATIRFRIAHFSTSHSYGSRRQEEEARNVRVSVWWDVETCSLPIGGFNGYRIVHSITNALRANGIRGPLQISAFGNVMKIPRGTQEALSSTGITLTHLPGGKEKDCVNRSMIIELMYWASQHPPPAHIFMITGDHGMASVLHRLRMSNYNILLAGPEDASIGLCSAASIVWQWNVLLTGENLVGKHFNQPPDGPSGSWYGTYRVPLESLLPEIEKPLPVRDSEPAESEVENVVQDIPPEITEQIQRILISYPNGVSIATLRQELSSNIIVDKNMYGYKKFSSLLLAMPQILELCPREHGQHLVRTVSSKALISTDSPMKSSENSIVSDTNCEAPPTEIEVCDDKTPLESTEELCTLNPLLITNEKSKLIESDHQSSPICNEQPLLKEECDRPPINVQDLESGSDSGSAPTEKQDNASEDGIFQRTWTKWFGDSNNDVAEQKEGNRPVQHRQSDYSRSYVAASDEISDKVDNSNDGVGKILKFCSRMLYGFKTDGIGSEAADAGMYSSDVPSQVAQHSVMNDAFSKDGFWSEIKAFLCSPEGEKVVSKSVSRRQIAWDMKKEGPSVLSSLGDDDLLHLVNLLIDDKNWIKECLSKTSPFKVKYASVKLRENSSDSNAKSCMLSDELQQADSQSEREFFIGSTNQSSSRLTSTESSEERKSRMLADCQKLLDAIVKTHPEGYNLSGFRKLFFERYHYYLKLNYLEFDKLTSLISTMSGVKLKGYVIYPSENSSSSTPVTHSDSSDSQFDEQLGPLTSLNKNAPSSPFGKPKTDKEPLLRYEPCSEEDIYTDSDGDTRTIERRLTGEAPKAHKEVSALIDILSNWEANKDVASKCNPPSETAPKDDLQNPIKCHSPGEVSRKTLRNTAQKWKAPRRTFNFVSDDHKNEGAVKDTTEARQKC